MDKPTDSEARNGCMDELCSAYIKNLCDVVATALVAPPGTDVEEEALCMVTALLSVLAALYRSCKLETETLRALQLKAEERIPEALEALIERWVEVGNA